jgi:hypothetical protein
MATSPLFAAGAARPVRDGQTAAEAAQAKAAARGGGVGVGWCGRALFVDRDSRALFRRYRGVITD